MLIFENLKIKNFLSVGNFPLSVDLNKHKTTLIVGANGQGKSTILDAITYVLFNKPFRKINLPQLVNNINNAELVIELSFSNNSLHYKIIRGMKPKIFEIYENGKMLQQDASNNDIQTYLENHILKMNYKTFTQVVVIGNATYLPFMKLPPTDRRVIVESFLNIDIFTKMNQLLKNKIVENKEKINDVSYKCDLSKEKVKMSQKLLFNSEETIQNQINQNNTEIEKYFKNILSKEEEISELNTEITNILVNDSDIERLKDHHTKLRDYLATFKIKHKTLQKEIEFLKTNDTCSTCNQNIDLEFKRKELETKENNISVLSDAIDSANDNLNKTNEKLTDLLSSLDEIQERKKKIELLQNDCSYIRKSIKKLEEKNQKHISERIQNTQKNQDDYNSVVKENTDLSEERDNLLYYQHLNAIGGILLKDGGIKTKIIKHYLPVMNKYINEYLRLMDFYINYTLDENFEEHIQHPSKENFSYNSFSEGEKLRIDLAILFSWREIAKKKNSTNTNLLIMDEIFDSSLDVSGTDDFISIISRLTENTNTFIISHKTDTISDRFENILRFEKINGFSKVV